LRLKLFIFIAALMASATAYSQDVPVSQLVPKYNFASYPIGEEVRSRMVGKSYPKEGCQIRLEDLRYLNVLYYNYEGKVCKGEIVCSKEIAEDLLDIFEELYKARYQIASIRLVDDFDGDDNASMEADNTSCFNYRAETHSRKLSTHARGLAIDINPRENPYVKGSTVEPESGREYADRTRDFPHKIDRNDLAYKLFREKGFHWGGAWNRVQDYQHFEKFNRPVPKPKEQPGENTTGNTDQ